MTTKSKILAPALMLALLLGTAAGPRRAVAEPARNIAPDLAKATAALALQSEDPPLTRSQQLEKQKREQEAAAAVEKQAEPDPTPYYKKWWFWAVTAAVVGGTVALGVWAVEPTTPRARACNPGVIACFGAGRGEVQ